MDRVKRRDHGDHGYRYRFGRDGWGVTGQRYQRDESGTEGVDQVEEQRAAGAVRPGPPRPPPAHHNGRSDQYRRSFRAVVGLVGVGGLLPGRAARRLARRASPDRAASRSAALIRPDGISTVAVVDQETMVGFGPKQAWLAVREGTPEPVAEALGLRDLGPVPWRSGVDLASLTDDRLVLTPRLPGAGGAEWLLVAGRWLLLQADRPVDVAELSATLGTEVQFFATYRVGELHRWARARDGRLVRSFGFRGENAEVTDWRGEPDAVETATGLPVEGPVPEGAGGVAGAGSVGPEILVSEHDVMRLAGAWSLDPTSLDSRPAPGPLRAAAAPS